MVTRQIVTPGDQGDVPPHEHDAYDISGTFPFLRVLNAIIQGDIKSNTWDGADQVPGSGATTGFFLDASTGAAEFTELFGDMVSANLRLLAQDETNEGGQMTYDGAGAHSTVLVTDRFQDTWRVIIGSNAPVTVGDTAVIVAISGTEVARFNSSGLVMNTGDAVESPTFRTKTGPDASDYWQVIEDDSGDALTIQQWNNSATAFIDRVKIAGDAAASNPGDVTVLDADGTVVAQWDESASAWIFSPGGSESARVDANGLRGLSHEYSDYDAESGTFTNTSYADLDALTGGTASFAARSVTVETGTSAMVMLAAANIRNGTAGSQALLSYRVSGATTISANDREALRTSSDVTINSGGFPSTITGLTPGSNTFELQARVTAGTGTLDSPRITVIPL